MRVGRENCVVDFFDRRTFAITHHVIDRPASLPFALFIFIPTSSPKIHRRPPRLVSPHNCLAHASPYPNTYIPRPHTQSTCSRRPPRLGAPIHSVFIYLFIRVHTQTAVLNLKSKHDFVSIFHLPFAFLSRCLPSLVSDCSLIRATPLQHLPQPDCSLNTSLFIRLPRVLSLYFHSFLCHFRSFFLSFTFASSPFFQGLLPSLRVARIDFYQSICPPVFSQRLLY